MPLIEVVPNSNSTATPGWAYVVDTGYDPSKAPIGAAGPRKRKAAPVAAAAELSVRQQNKIARHLEELDKDNNRAVQIEVPGKPKDVAARGLRHKITPGVKKILLSQKTFANHLADEEAALANQPSSSEPIPTTAAFMRQASIRTKKESTRRASRVTRRSTSGPSATPDPTTVSEKPAPHEPAPAPPAQTTHNGPDVDVVEQVDPFLKSQIPSLPTHEAIQALLDAPPLSYVAARAAPTASSAPARQFCGMCGYWGLARCLKCGARYCGLECKGQHDETQCTRF